MAAAREQPQADEPMECVPLLAYPPGIVQLTQRYCKPISLSKPYMNIHLSIAAKFA